MLWVLKLAKNKYLLGGIGVLVVVAALGVWMFTLGRDSRQNTIDDLSNEITSYQIRVSSMQSQIEFSEKLHLDMQELKSKQDAQVAAINKVAAKIPKVVTTTYNVNKECVPSEEFSQLWNQLNHSQ